MNPERRDSSRKESPSLSPTKYLLVVLGLPALFLAIGFSMAHTRWFFYHDDYFLLRNIGYSLTLDDANCEVVLTGDSSALTGLDPATITRYTGMSACNVAEGGTIDVVIGNYALDAYLRHNSAPKFVVFMFTPSFYRPLRSWSRDSSSYVEGIVYLLQYRRDAETYKILLKHPWETLAFSIWASHAILADSWTRIAAPHKYDRLEDPFLRRQRTFGRFTLYAGPETHCFRNGWDKTIPVVPDPNLASSLRRQYGTNGTQVIVNVAPVPDCDDMHDVYERALSGLHDNDLEVLPIRMFNSQDVHFTPEGAEQLSIGVARQILKLEPTLKMERN